MQFGLGPVPRIFTKIMKPIVAFLRRLGVRMVIYLDDKIISNQSHHQLLKDLSSLRFLLEQLGFLINWKKSLYILVQKIDFLGFQIDSIKMMIYLPLNKILEIKEKCQNLINQKSGTARDVAEVLGHITQSLQAIAPAPLHYRYLKWSQIRALLIRKSYSTRVHLSPDCLGELRWWIF